jgi:hypothetical protein
MSDLPERRLPFGPILPIASGVVIILVAAVLLWNTFWGDPSIYLPYARNIARGDFFSYTPGAFSSGSTSPLWALLLSIPYLAGLDVAGARILSLAATLGAFLLVVSVSRRVNGPTTGAALATLYLVEMLTLFGLLMYESSLVVALVAGAILLGLRVREKWERDDYSFVGLLPLALLWSALPVARPDAVVLIVLQVVALWWTAPRRTTMLAAKLLAAAAIAAIPSLLYFGYSYTALGVVSVSSQNRAFALRESASRVGPILYSKPALVYIGSILYALVLAAIGIDMFRREPRERWLAIFAVGSLLVYPFLLVFISPVTNDLPRYFLPVAPLVVLAVGRTLGRWEENRWRAWSVSAALLVALFLLKPAASTLGEAFEQRGRGYTFDEIVERDAAEALNRVALVGERVLAYEVQDRYYLRNDLDLLSLDGITDGRVAPYLESADMGAFLKRYRPRYWIANEAVDYRPYLKRSILHQAVESFRNDSTLLQKNIAGIDFVLLERRRAPMPRGFAGWEMVFRLGY